MSYVGRSNEQPTITLIREDEEEASDSDADAAGRSSRSRSTPRDASLLDAFRADAPGAPVSGTVGARGPFGALEGEGAVTKMKQRAELNASSMRTASLGARALAWPVLSGPPGRVILKP
jgi:hypothetical protein